ncbi:MAG TPA: hypothetical protein VFT99_06685 [Roseiflexaceae bacterium]|nr:hypothetical protein [Roseiflexaceae bacterium]
MRSLKRRALHQRGLENQGELIPRMIDAGAHVDTAAALVNRRHDARLN